MSDPVVIVGGGMAGLACALRLSGAGVPVLLLEASDGVGGRVRSDRVDGFNLDRGFQVLLTAYPEARRILDYDALDLRSFRPGALVRYNGDFHLVTDPTRWFTALVESLRAPVGSFADKMATARLRFAAAGADTATLLSRGEGSTRDELRRLGFSGRYVARFLGPLFAGIQLDGDLEAPAGLFHFVFGMLAQGLAAVPAQGMQAIPDQMADGLPEGSIHLGSTAAAVEANSVTLADGSVVSGSAVVVAVEGPEAARLIGVDDPGSRPVACHYFAADESPLSHPVIALDGDSSGPINNLAVMSDIAPDYAPPGTALVAAAVLDPAASPDDVRRQLGAWFGPAAAGWEWLRTYVIPHAQPGPVSPVHEMRDARVGAGVYVAGDHRATPSINGALASGTATADAVLAALD